jgi:hypothetical protein
MTITWGRATRSISADNNASSCERKRCKNSRLTGVENVIFHLPNSKITHRNDDDVYNNNNNNNNKPY